MPVQVLAYFDTSYQTGTAPDPWQALRQARPQSRRYPALNWPSTLGAYDLADPAQASRVVAMAASAGIDGFVVELLPTAAGYSCGAAAIAAQCRPGRFGLAFNWRNQRDAFWTAPADADARRARAGQLVAAMAEHRDHCIGGRVVLTVEAPAALAGAPEALALLRDAAKKAGLDDLYLIASRADFSDVRTQGYDAALDPDPSDWGSCPPSNRPSGLDVLEIQAGLRDSVELTDKFYPYQLFIVSRMINREKRGKVFPRVFPAYFDWATHPDGGATLVVNHDAASGVDQYMFGLFIENAMIYAHQSFAPSEQYVFLDSWNHWLEGSQIEPSVLDGDQIYLTVREAIDKARFILRGRGERLDHRLDPALHQRIAEICEAAAAAAVKSPG